MARWRSPTVGRRAKPDQTSVSAPSNERGSKQWQIKSPPRVLLPVGHGESELDAGTALQLRAATARQIGDVDLWRYSMTVTIARVI